MVETKVVESKASKAAEASKTAETYVAPKKEPREGVELLGDYDQDYIVVVEGFEHQKYMIKKLTVHDGENLIGAALASLSGFGAYAPQKEIVITIACKDMLGEAGEFVVPEDALPESQFTSLASDVELRPYKGSMRGINEPGEPQQLGGKVPGSKDMPAGPTEGKKAIKPTDEKHPEQDRARPEDRGY